MSRLATFALLAAASTLTLACGSKPPPPAPAPTAGSPFVAQKVEGLGDPEILVTNTTALQLIVEVGGSKGGTITIAPGQTLSMRIGGGDHPFKAYAPNSPIDPLEGSELFESDHRYTWVFTIKKPVSTGWYCYPVGALLLACERTSDACEARRTKPGESPRPPCSLYAEPWTFADTAKDAIWFSKDEATCEKSRTGYLVEVGPPKPEAVEHCKPTP